MYLLKSAKATAKKLNIAESKSMSRIDVTTESAANARVMIAFHRANDFALEYSLRCTTWHCSRNLSF